VFSFPFLITFFFFLAQIKEAFTAQKEKYTRASQVRTAQRKNKLNSKTKSRSYEFPMRMILLPLSKYTLVAPLDPKLVFDRFSLHRLSLTLSQHLAPSKSSVINKTEPD
jgi:hypothetical protein